MWQLMQWYVYSSDWSWPYYMLLSNLPIVTIHSQCNLPIHYKESKRNWNLTLYVLVFEYFRLTCQLILPLLTWAGVLRSRQVTTTWHLPRLQLHVSVECFRPKVSLHSHFRSQQFLQIIAPVLEFCEWVIFIPFQFPNLGKEIFILFPLPNLGEVYFHFPFPKFGDVFYPVPKLLECNFPLPFSNS